MLVKLVLDVNFMFHVDVNLTEKLRQFNCKVTSIEVKTPGNTYLSNIPVAADTDGPPPGANFLVDVNYIFAADVNLTESVGIFGQI